MNDYTSLFCLAQLFFKILDFLKPFRVVFTRRPEGHVNVSSDIIRDEAALQRIRQYIRNNPRAWQTDRLNAGNEEDTKEVPAAYTQEPWMA